MPLRESFRNPLQPDGTSKNARANAKEARLLGMQEVVRAQIEPCAASTKFSTQQCGAPAAAAACPELGIISFRSFGPVVSRLQRHTESCVFQNFSVDQ